MRLRVLRVLPVVLFLLAAFPLPAGANGRSFEKGTALEEMSAKVTQYYVDHPLNVSSNKLQTARFMQLRDNNLLFPIGMLQGPWHLDVDYIDSREWTNKADGRRYFMWSNKGVGHVAHPDDTVEGQYYNDINCERIGPGGIASTRCNIQDVNTVLEYKWCAPSSSCTYFNPWGSRDHHVLNVTGYEAKNASHSFLGFGGANGDAVSFRSRGPCTRVRFLNPFSNPPWQGLHLTHWYKGTSGIVNAKNHYFTYFNGDTVGLQVTSDAEKAACDAGQ